MPNGIGSRLKTGPSQTGQLPGRIKSELCDLSGLRIDLISRLLSLSRLYSGILHSLSLYIDQGMAGRPPATAGVSLPFGPCRKAHTSKVAASCLYNRPCRINPAPLGLLGPALALTALICLGPQRTTRTSGRHPQVSQAATRPHSAWATLRMFGTLLRFPLRLLWRLHSINAVL